MECFLGNVAVRIHDLVEQYKKTATGRKKIMPMMKKYYPKRFDDLDVDEFIKIHNNKPMEEVYYFNVGCYSNYTPEKVQQILMHEVVHAIFCSESSPDSRKASGSVLFP